MNYRDIPDSSIAGARLIYKNFSGKPSQFNKDGDRNFCVVIPDKEMAEDLIQDGWNVKIHAPREEGDEPWHYLSVKVKFGSYPPKIVQVTPNRENKMYMCDEEYVDKYLDSMQFANVDLVIRPYQWENSRGETGVAAYLKAMYFTPDEDEFAAKYAAYEEGA